MSGQTQFRAALLDPAMPVPGTLTDGAGRPAGRRFAVYRNNVAVSLTEALIDGFPACHQLMGDQMFRAMAGAYLRAHPPASPLMMQFGQALPEFMDAAPQLSNMRWIGDLARLELALRAAYHAADAPALDMATLAAIAPDDLPDQRFGLAPALRILRSDWPVWSIWQQAQDASAPPAQPGGEDVLIARVTYDPVAHRLRPGDATMIAALQAGEPLGTAMEAALAAVPDHDASAILTLLMQTQSLTAYRPPHPPTHTP